MVGALDRGAGVEDLAYIVVLHHLQHPHDAHPCKGLHVTRPDQVDVDDAEIVSARLRFPDDSRK